ncbi:MarR family transcriptional regulator [Micromonospora ureilytica]|uniref:MarR family winged helix-turn-helix transcriptional regulator n=1 Tax=Micromonospora ureilytica TaxID=709868 RepID=UPI0033E4E6B0
MTTSGSGRSSVNLAGRLASGELAERTGLTTGATTRLIDRLERAGHVRRTADPADRRRVLVEPVPKLDVDTIVGPARQRLGELFQQYRPEELAVLFDYFDRAADPLLTATREVRAQRRSPEAAGYRSSGCRLRTVSSPDGDVEVAEWADSGVDGGGGVG